MPIPLWGSTLSIWLAESGLNKNAIGLFSLVSLPLCLKFFWSPIIDSFALPGFRSTPRKGWLLFALTGMSLSLFALSFVNPSIHPYLLAFLFMCLSFFTGCLYMVGLSYELESIADNDYSVGSACVITGYRLGLLIAGSGTLAIAHLFDWSTSYQLMSFIVFLGSFYVLLQPEPYQSKAILTRKKELYGEPGSFLKKGVQEILLNPCQLFFQKPHWKGILLLLLSFKIGDHFVRSMTGPFYLSLGFNKGDLALASKFWGVGMTIFGAFFASRFLKQKNPFFAVSVCGFIHACTISCFYFLSMLGKSYSALYLCIALENLTGGMAMTAFVYLLWKLCDKQYAATQYALLWSFFSVKADLLACCGGLLAARCTWETYFLTVSLISILVSCLLVSLIMLKKIVPYSLTFAPSSNES